MCGIAGIYQQSGEPVASELLRQMTNSIAHRGPDGEGQFIKGGLGLGHRRLSIIDLSDAGRQPMADASNELVLVYNGEIYNFKELRKELEAAGHRFKSRTDTEVLLYAYKQWGEACVNRFNGMFAFALYDQPKQKLFLARDRYGIKPLYWYFKDGRFVFASEIKAILQHPAVQRRISYSALNEYLTFQNILSDATLFDGVRLLPPATTLTLDLKSGAQPKLQRYWDFAFKPQENLTEKECEDRLYDLFVASVKRQLVSDVPIGAYLSGGMDSGSIVAVARGHLGRLSTFTGGFDLSSASGLELGFDERKNSELVANLLKTEHYEMVMHAGDMEHIMPPLIWHLEDLRVGQCYPNFYVARLAGKFVKVVMSGAGGDEIFGGYPWRYFTGMENGNGEYHKRYYAFWQRLVSDEEKEKAFTSDVRRSIGDHSTFETFRSVFNPQLALKSNEDLLSASLYFELKTFLHGLLVVEDKVSMAHSLETRVPFLDNELVDFALQIPARYKVNDLSKSVRVDENTIGKRHLAQLKTNAGKAILRKAMSRLIPKDVTDRVKQGFSAPDASWYRGESIDYVNRVLRNPKALINEFVRPDYVANILDQHCNGIQNRRLLIWSLLSLETWCEQFLKSPLPLAASMR
jgi:asparagine synthase (glutamine-hydrolysing)